MRRLHVSNLATVAVAGLESLRELPAEHYFLVARVRIIRHFLYTHSLSAPYRWPPRIAKNPPQEIKQSGTLLSHSEGNKKAYIVSTVARIEVNCDGKFRCNSVSAVLLTGHASHNNREGNAKYPMTG